MRKAVLITVALLVLAPIALFAYLAKDLGEQFFAARVTQQQFDAQAIGASEADVRAALPEPLTMDDQAVYGDDPGKQGKPAGASCIYYGVEPLSDSGAKPMYRLCFVGGALAEKSRIAVSG